MPTMMHVAVLGQQRQAAALTNLRGIVAYRRVSLIAMR
jgi:hypothetical protein